MSTHLVSHLKPEEETLLLMANEIVLNFIYWVVRQLKCINQRRVGACYAICHTTGWIFGNTRPPTLPPFPRRQQLCNVGLSQCEWDRELLIRLKSLQLFAEAIKNWFVFSRCREKRKYQHLSLHIAWHNVAECFRIKYVSSHTRDIKDSTRTVQ